MYLYKYSQKIESLLKDHDQNPVSARISLDNSRVKCWVFLRGASQITICIRDGQETRNHSLDIEINSATLSLWSDGITPLCLTRLGRSHSVISQCKICDSGFSMTLSPGQIDIASTVPLQKTNVEVINQVFNLVDEINIIGESFGYISA
jgi:hypothetical protein